MHKPFTTAVLLLAVCFLGCMRPVGLPRPLPPLDPAGLDLQVLKGKIIIIDPGHGGSEQGAVGARGLKESEVNLGVALYLWGLLKNAGASPVLTRSSDTGVHTATALSIQDELNARAALGNACNADLFVSIHHNSAADNLKKNNLMVFFKMSDPLQSRDIAREICTALTQTMHADVASVHPGNYRVLRYSVAPAVLGEASFMTNKKNETALAFHRTLSAEARGYFLGIVRYFQKGVPSIDELSPDNCTLTAPRPLLSARLHPGSDTGAVDSSSIHASLNGIPVTDYIYQDNGLLSWTPPAPLHNGRHQFCVSIRNRAGNCSPRACASFAVALPPQHISLLPLFSEIPADGMASTPIDIEVRDALQRPVIDGTPVRVSSAGGSIVHAQLTTKGGKARAVLTADERKRTAVVTAESGGVRSRCTVMMGVPAQALFMATIRDPSGRPVEGAALLRGDQQVSFSDEEGFVYDSVVDTEKASYTLVKKGYAPLPFSPSLMRGILTVENVLLEPLDGGIFFNRTIVLDPAPSSGAALHILLSEVKRLIEHAGGTAVLTWEQPPEPPPASRVKVAESAPADVFLTVQAAGKQCSAGYYQKSLQGRRLADLLCGHLAGTAACSQRACAPAVSCQYVIVQTAMPAVWLTVPEACTASGTAAAIYRALQDFFQAMP